MKMAEKKKPEKESDGMAEGVLRAYPKSPAAWYVIHVHARCSMAR